MFMTGCVCRLSAQQSTQQALSPSFLQHLRDSANYADVVFYPPAQESISLEGRNVAFLASFIEPVYAPEAPDTAAGYISFQINGQEVLFARLFLPRGQSGGYIVSTIAGQSLRSKLTDSGAAFLRKIGK